MPPYEKVNFTDAEKRKICKDISDAEAYKAGHKIKLTTLDNSIKWLKQTDINQEWKNKPVNQYFHDIEFEQGQRVLEWALPGHGQSYLQCGSVFISGCDNFYEHSNHKGKAEMLKRSCKRLECPTCYESASSHRALTSLTRFATFFRQKQPLEKYLRGLVHEYRHSRTKEVKKLIINDLEQFCAVKSKPVKHIVASPPQTATWAEKKAFLSNRSYAYKVLKLAGSTGGLVIPHPYRLKCEKCGHHPIPDHKRTCPKCGHERFIWYFSPHFHCLGFGWIKNTKQNYGVNGWIVKNLGIRNSIYATVQYLLSHAGIAKRVLTITWFGELGTRTKGIGKTATIPRIRHYCNECDVPYMMLQWIKTDRPPDLVYNDFDDKLNEWHYEPGEWQSYRKA